MNGVERLSDAFELGRTEGRALLMPFLVCGYPDPDTFVALAEAAAQAGADALEIGIPFSDPIMDGPVIQAASTAVLERGQPIDDALALIARATERAGVPATAMTYYNVAYRRGVDRFAADLAAAGAAGAILPDLSVEDATPWREAAAAAGIATVFIAAQTSPPQRLRAVGDASQGFIYAASLLGVTGVRASLSDAAGALVARIREASDRPVALGIGVSTPEHAAEAAAFADGVIVGSALVRAIADAADPVDACSRLVGAMRDAIAARVPGTTT